MKKNWYVVANRKAARIYIKDESKENSKPLRLVKTIKNPLGELKRKDLFKTQAGKSIRSVGRIGAIHFAEVKRNDPIDEVAIQFAKQITDYLRKQQTKDAFGNLTVVAEPKFLGKIRTSMHPILKDSVQKWIRKDLMNTPQDKLPVFLLAKKRKTNSYRKSF